MRRDGPHEATISDIAVAAALGKGTVYLQFESKHDLVDGLRHRYIQRIEDEVRDQLAEAASTSEKLRVFVRSFIAASTRDPDLHHLLFQDAGVDEANAFAPLREIFAGIVRDGGFGASTSDLAIDYALGGIHAAAITVAHLPPRRRSRPIAETVDLVGRTLGAIDDGLPAISESSGHSML